MGLGDEFHLLPYRAGLLTLAGLLAPLGQQRVQLGVRVQRVFLEVPALEMQVYRGVRQPVVIFSEHEKDRLLSHNAVGGDTPLQVGSLVELLQTLFNQLQAEREVLTDGAQLRNGKHRSITWQVLRGARGFQEE